MPENNIDRSQKNKERTKQKLILAVGEIIRSEGFEKLRISAIARKAQVDRKLIYRYFGGLDFLIEAYITEHEFWLLYAERIKELIVTHESSNGQELLNTTLRDYFTFLSSEKDMQQLRLLELSAHNPLLKSLRTVRESLLQKILELTDKHFVNSGVDIRAVILLLVGGINFILLNTLYNGDQPGGLDVLSEDGRQQMLGAIEKIVNWAYMDSAGKVEKIS